MDWAQNGNGLYDLALSGEATLVERAAYPRFEVFCSVRIVPTLYLDKQHQKEAGGYPILRPNLSALDLPWLA